LATDSTTSPSSVNFTPLFQQVEQHLPQPIGVAGHDGGDSVVDLVQQFEALGCRLAAHQVE
jgi:hypothetical protein